MSVIARQTYYKEYVWHLHSNFRLHFYWVGPTLAIKIHSVETIMAFIDK